MFNAWMRRRQVLVVHRREERGRMLALCRRIRGCSQSNARRDRHNHRATSAEIKETW